MPLIDDGYFNTNIKLASVEVIVVVKINFEAMIENLKSLLSDYTASVLIHLI